MSYTKVGGLRRLVGIGLNRGIQSWESQVLPKTLGVSCYGGPLGFVPGRNRGAGGVWSPMTSRLAFSTSVNPKSTPPSVSNPRDEERKGDYKVSKTSFFTMLDRLSDVLFLNEIFRGLALTAEVMFKPKVRRIWGWVSRNAYVAVVGGCSIREGRRSALEGEFE